MSARQSNGPARACATNGPTRTCVGCGRRDRQSAMLRLRLDADGRIVREGAIRTGRSAYVHESEDCIRAISRSKGLARSLRTTVAKDARLELVRSLEEDRASRAGRF